MIEAKLDTRKIEAAMKKAPGLLAVHLSKRLNAFGYNYVDDFATERMGVPDDRDPADFLLRRPQASQGLVNRSGSLARGLNVKTAKATKLADVEMQMGFGSSLLARIARVHELGTVGKGGTLPDIVPRSARFLAVPVRSVRAALGAKTRVVLLKNVAIPARLGWRDFWNKPETQARVQKAIVKAAQDALAQATGKAAGG